MLSSLAAVAGKKSERLRRGGVNGYRRHGVADVQYNGQGAVGCKQYADYFAILLINTRWRDEYFDNLYTLQNDVFGMLICFLITLFFFDFLNKCIFI